MQTQMVGGPLKYKRKYKLWLLILLVIVCWPIAIVYYFTREKVPVQEYQTYVTPTTPQASGPGAPSTGAQPAPGPSPACPRCGKPTTWVAQYGRYYCTADQQYV